MQSVVRTLIHTVAAAAVITVAAGLPAQAAINFTVGNNPQTDENVLLNNGMTGPSVVGNTNMTGTPVMFSSTIDTLSAPSNGQARVEATDGLVNNISISVPGNSYQTLIFNPFDGDGTLFVSVLSNMGISNFNYGIGNGQNFLTIVASGGEKILNTTLNAADGFQDLRQIRIGGFEPLEEQPPSSVPEPASMALLGMGALPLLRRLRRRR